jgi:predicted AAA+ superfamily ATPase
MPAYERPLLGKLQSALERLPRLIHVLAGPRQVGKTTIALTIADRWKGPTHYAAADELFPPSVEWIRNQWEVARAKSGRGRCLLVLDEIQKVVGWSEIVKSLWDAERRRSGGLQVILLGSSALRLAAGTSESLAGRFFLHRCPHWSFVECRAAFGWSLERWIYFGGYPGAADLAGDLDTWRAYVRDSLVESVLGRDVLSLQRVTKPALLRHLFAFACRFPAQVVSYTKMLGQLHEAGNTTTLAHYLRLLETAFLVSGLERFSPGRIRSRGSAPKLVVWNNALVNAVNLQSFAEARRDSSWWGRLVENAVGAHFANHLEEPTYELCWWRDGAYEVDYVVRSGRQVWGIEVKSGRERPRITLDVFAAKHPKARTLLIGPGGVTLEDFFTAEPARLLQPSG